MINRLKPVAIESQIIQGGGGGPQIKFKILTLIGGEEVSIKSQWHSDSPIMIPSLIDIP